MSYEKLGKIKRKEPSRILDSSAFQFGLVLVTFAVLFGLAMLLTGLNSSTVEDLRGQETGLGLETQTEAGKQNEADVDPVTQGMENESSRDQTVNKIDPYADYNESLFKIEDLASYDKRSWVDIADLYPRFKIDLKNTQEPRWKYLDSDGTVVDTWVTKDYETAILRVGTAEKLMAANQEFIDQHNLRLVVIEAYRTPETQAYLREHYSIKYNIPLADLGSRYVAFPMGSNHQRGIAVDVTLQDLETGQYLRMPSLYLETDGDIRAVPDPSTMSETVQKNVSLLQDVLNGVGLESYYYEWWHFNDNDLKSQAGASRIKPDDYDTIKK